MVAWRVPVCPRTGGGIAIAELPRRHEDTFDDAIDLVRQFPVRYQRRRGLHVFKRVSQGRRSCLLQSEPEDRSAHGGSEGLGQE